MLLSDCILKNMKVKHRRLIRDRGSIISSSANNLWHSRRECVFLVVRNKKFIILFTPWTFSRYKTKGSKAYKSGESVNIQLATYKRNSYYIQLATHQDLLQGVDAQLPSSCRYPMSHQCVFEVVRPTFI